jgi:hypothetical protein
MTQDCLNSPSTADVSTRLPKGIHVTGADDKSDPAIEGMPWSHLLIGGVNTYVVRKMRKTQYKLQKLYLVVTYCDEEKQEWHMLMPDELREALSSNYKFYLDLAEKGQKGPTAKQPRMMAAMKRFMGQ